jgi:DNA-directed RNA polymerase specialized sigma24 family protein
MPPPGKISRDQPVAASPKDEDVAFRNLYAEHGSALLRVTTALTGADRSRAEDFVQESMLQACTHRTNSDFQHRSPGPG